jgi:hypothetical protein
VSLNIFVVVMNYSNLRSKFVEVVKMIGFWGSIRHKIITLVGNNNFAASHHPLTLHT